MKIILTNAGKRYNRDWVFRNLNYTFYDSSSYAITGANGSGKSTLLQTLGAAIILNEGKGEWIKQEKSIAAEDIFKYVSICAPYLELVEEFTLEEFLTFHQSFKPFIPGKTINGIISEIGLDKARGKRINQFSSGMKQRVKLAQCLFSNTPLILLDEPCTNLDQQGIDLYHHLIASYANDRLVIVSSNDQVEYSFCKNVLNIMDYK